MPDRAELPELTPKDAHLAVAIAMTVRNAMEDFHVQHLSDEQMAELNPIIRNAVATALHARANLLRNRAARAYIEFQEMLIPDYWESPGLLDDYVESWQRAVVRYANEKVFCAKCGREIVDSSLGERERWTHLAADGGTNVGCRAASFTVADGWDDALDRKWIARPRRRKSLSETHA